MDIWKVVAWCAATGTACIAGTWTLVTWNQGNELAAYRAADEWKVKEAIHAMTALSRELKIDVEEQRELSDLRSLKPKYFAESERARNLEERNTALEQKLASFVRDSTSITIENGGVFSVVTNEVLMAVVDTSPASKVCFVRLGEKSERMDLGNALNADFGGVRYRFILTKVSRDSCEFLYSKIE